MRRLKPKVFKTGSVALILALALGRYIFLATHSSVPSAEEGADELFASAPHGVEWGRTRPIYSLRGQTYASVFDDMQDTQIVAAHHWGITPVKDRAQAELRKDELVYVGSSPLYVIDEGMKRSIPYLVPRAADLLHTIAANFIDSLAVKGIPSHKIIVTSVLRTEDDIEKLRRYNRNASPESCHRYGTTIDIAYSRYHTVCPPEERRREVRNDSLKMVLGEVLYDLRAQGRCFVKHERRQGCFHITTR